VWIRWRWGVVAVWLAWGSRSGEGWACEQESGAEEGAKSIHGEVLGRSENRGRGNGLPGQPIVFYAIATVTSVCVNMPYSAP